MEPRRRCNCNCSRLDSLLFSCFCWVPQARYEALRSAHSQLEEERNQLKRALIDTENRATRSEFRCCSLEGELHRIVSEAADKEDETKTMNSRLQSLTAQLSDSESIAQALRTNINRLNEALSNSDEEIGVHKDKVSSLIWKIRIK